MGRFTLSVCLAFTEMLISARASGQQCEPGWDQTLWGSSPPGAEVRLLARLSDSGVTRLYGGTSAYGTGESGWFVTWDGPRLVLLAEVRGEMTGSSSIGVYAATVFDDGSGPAIYIGGVFTTIDGAPIAGVAKRTGKHWQSLGAGTDRGVRALCMFDDGSGPALYAGGFFWAAGSVKAAGVAKWNGRVWDRLGEGLAGGAPTGGNSSDFPVCYALAGFDDGTGPALYAGGNFDSAGGAPAASIARWDGAVWHPVGNGLKWNGGQAAVLTLRALDLGAGPALYASGEVNFGTLNPNPQVVRWSGSAWQPVGPWVSSIWVQALAVADLGAGPRLYAGTYGGLQPHVHRLEGKVWEGLAIDGRTRALETFDTGSGPNLFAGGSFTSMGGVPARNVARWTGTEWFGLPGNGSDAAVQGFRVLDAGEGPELYAFGSPRISGTAMPGIGRFDGESWHPVGPGGGSPIRDAEFFDDGGGLALYAAGSFSTPAGSARVARLHGNSWQAVGYLTAPFQSGSVSRLMTFDDGTGLRLYAGGTFTGGVAAWDGAAWTLPGGGLPTTTGGSVHDLEVVDDGSGPRLFAAWGSVVSWWSGASWRPTGSLPSASRVRLTAADEGIGERLYAAGHDVDEGFVARLDGSAWTVLAEAVAGRFEDIAAFDDGAGMAIYVGGEFSEFLGHPANNLARYREGAWTGFADGPNERVLALGVFDRPGPTLWLGGDFVAAGGHSSERIARWMGCTPCYPDCSKDGLLTVADFACFQARFAAGHPYADCNGQGGLTVADFACFQSSFSAGCP